MKNCTKCPFRSEKWKVCQLDVPFVIDGDATLDKRVDEWDNCPVIFLLHACHKQRDRARLSEKLLEEALLQADIESWRANRAELRVERLEAERGGDRGEEV